MPHHQLQCNCIGIESSKLTKDADKSTLEHFEKKPDYRNKKLFYVLCFKCITIVMKRHGGKAHLLLYVKNTLNHLKSTNLHAQVK